MKVSRPLALSLLLLLGSSPAAHRAQAFEIERLSHRPDRIRLSSDEPLLVRFDRSLDASTVGTDAITLTRQDPQGVRRIPGHVELESTVVPMDTLRFVPESEGLRFGRRHRIAFAQRLRGSDGSSLENVDHTRLRFVINKPANLSEVPLALGTALLGYDPLDPEGTDLDDAIQIPGISVTQAWKRTVGRPDVLVAILDTGFESYGSPGLRDAIFLNRGELPRPLGAADYDANRDGRFNARDYHGDARVGDANGDGFLDAGDLITAFENGEDDDGNGLIDDISGYDFFREAPRALGVHDFLEGTHGEGRALEVAGAAGADTGEIVGACPDCTVVPIRVSDTILVEGNVFARAMRYAAGLGADIALAAVGGINNASEARRAVDEGWDAGLFLVAASGDELAFHHNFPATLARVYQVKSVFPLPGRFDLGDLPFDLPLGFAHYVETICTNHGAHLDATVSSSNCSSESAGNLAGGAGLVLARALDLGIELSPGELRQILNGSADDIADSCIVLTDGGCQEGWDSHFGYGRTNIRKAVELLGDPEQAIGARIPPEVDIRSPEWFVTIDPEVTPTLDVVARIRARGRDLSYTLEAATGVEPLDPEFRIFARGDLSEDFEGSVGQIDLVDLFDGAPPSGRVFQPDAPTVTIRIRVTVADGTRGEDRRAIGVHRDATLLPGFPISLGASGESSPLLVDLGTGPPGELDVVLGDSDGRIHAFRRDPADGRWKEAPGFPVTLPPVRPRGMQPGFADAILAATAYGDLEGDGSGYAIVAATLNGRIFAIHPRGNAHLDASGSPAPILPGFPVSAIQPSRATSRSWGHGRSFPSTPMLTDLDDDGSLEIVVGSLDQRLYAFHGSDRDGDGRADPVAGFPVLLRSDTESVAAEFVCLESGEPAIEASIIGSPTAVVLDPGNPDPALGTHPSIIVPTTELCDENGDGESDSSRYYAVWHDGYDHDGGPFLPGWPLRTPLTFLGAAIPLPPLTTGGDFGAAAAHIDGETVIYGGNFFGQAFLVRTRGETPEIELLLSGDQDLAAAGGASFAVLDRESGIPSIVLPVTTILDEDSAGIQALDHSLVAWRAARPVERQLRVKMDDVQFLMNPAVADVSGDGRPEAVSGSGHYLLRAYDLERNQPEAWPHYTQGWIVASPALGDLDGDGKLETVVSTREGHLFAWHTEGAACLDDQPQAGWRTFHHDEHRTGVMGHDSLAPSRPLDFQATSDGDGVIELRWTAPGGNGVCGRAARYDLRFSADAELDLSDPEVFDEAQRIATPPRPATGGSAESFRFEAPTGATRFAIRAIDETGLVGLPQTAALGASGPETSRPARGHSGGCGVSRDSRGGAMTGLPLLALLALVGRVRKLRKGSRSPARRVAAAPVPADPAAVPDLH